MNWQQLVQTIDPAITDKQADHLLWERTCFPFGPVRTVYEQLQSAVRANRSRIHICDYCHNKVVKAGSTCPTCESGFKKLREYIAKLDNPNP